MPDAGAPTLVSLHVVHKTYDGPSTGGPTSGGPTSGTIIHDLSLSIRAGEFVCLVGPSGCGKTTALRILLGLDRHFEGRVAPDPSALRSAIVFQEPRLLPWRSVEENIRLVLPPRTRDADLTPLFDELGLEAWRTHHPAELSLGLARRAALARALAIRPALLVLDEAFVSLDTRAAAELQALVVARLKRDGMAVLLVTHDLREALRLADRIVLLSSRPARILDEIVLARVRDDRPAGWIETERAAVLARFDAAHRDGTAP